VVDIHSQADLDKLLDGAGDKLVVLDLGLTYCEPCVKVSRMCNPQLLQACASEHQYLLNMFMGAF
jgi:hypothetical protein